MDATFLAFYLHWHFLKLYFAIAQACLSHSLFAQGLPLWRESLAYAQIFCGRMLELDHSSKFQPAW